EAYGARLIEKDFPNVPRLTRKRGLHAHGQGAEENKAAVLEEERDAECQDDLRVVAFGLGRDHAGAGDARYQETVREPAENEDDGAGEQSGGDRSRVWP